MEDPMEKIIAEALRAGGFQFDTGEGGNNPTGLDFFLPGADLHIEVKRFHSDRIAEQMSRAANVIALQGEGAVRFFARCIAPEAAEDNAMPAGRPQMPGP